MHDVRAVQLKVGRGSKVRTTKVKDGDIDHELNNLHCCKVFLPLDRVTRTGHEKRNIHLPRFERHQPWHSSSSL
jgi:hypothetical protein